MRRTLEEIQAAATEDARLLATMLPDATRLLTAAHSDLGIANELPGIAESLHSSAGDILGIARHADGTVDAAHARVNLVVELVDQLNRELSSIDGKLAQLPGRLPGAGRSGDGEATPR